MRSVVLSILLLGSVVLEADTSIVYGTNSNQNAPKVENEKDIKLYTIQIASTKSLKEAKEVIASLPKEIQEKISLYKIKKYIAIRYDLEPSMRYLKDDLKKIRKLGVKDAYIVQTTKWHVKTEAISLASSKGKKNTKKSLEIKPKKTISNYKLSQWIAKANKAYANGDEMSTILYYEMILSSGANSEAIKNNLCYLYGKHNAWEDAQAVFKKEKNIFKYLYAYEYGAVEANNKDFIKDMSEYILLDKSGRLALLAGYYFEQNDQLEKAFSYYKMAYMKDPTSGYNVFAYARSLDIQGKKYEAIKYYKKAIVLKGLHKEAKEMIERRIEILRRQL